MMYLIILVDYVHQNLNLKTELNTMPEKMKCTERMKARAKGQKNSHQKSFKKRKERLLLKGNSILMGKCRDA